MVAQIDERLKALDERLAKHEQLIRERDRLRSARATLLGDGPVGRVSQEHVAAFLAEHPGSRPREIASVLGVSSGRVSAHLFRGKTTRFVRRGELWYLREGQ